MLLYDRFEELRASLPREAWMEARIEGLTPIASGKVREVFDLGERLLIVATDRVSAFDVVMPNGIPGKGILLTQLSLFWFGFTADCLPGHLVEDQPGELERLLPNDPALRARSMLVRKLKPLPVEAVVRGYLAGSAWKEYSRTGTVQGHSLPPGLRQGDPLPEPIFTPTTKAQSGHDEPLTEAECARILGPERFETVRRATLDIFQRAHQRALEADLILADTKFEFGENPAGELFLIDEVLTSDSSRYWPRSEHSPGGPQPSFDKQIVRDYLESLTWDKTPPAPPLPPEVIERTRELYLEALRRLAYLSDTR